MGIDDFTAFESTWLRGSFELHCLSGSFATNTRRFESQTSKLVETVNNCDYDLLGQFPRIPRLMGVRIESQTWSVFMVVEHLRMHTEFLLHAIQALLVDDKFRATVPDYRYLVPEDVGANCIDHFQESVWQYNAFANNLLESGRFRESTGAIRHPVYGRLNVKRLHALASFHCRIHRKQVQKILATEGIV